MTSTAQQLIESRAGVAPVTRIRPDIAVSLSTRIALSSRELIDRVVEETGLSIREVIEQALDARWGSDQDDEADQREAAHG